MFFHRRVFIIEMLLYAVVDEACRATNVLLIAAVTRELAYWSCFWFFNFEFQIRVHIVYYMVEVVCCFFISCLEVNVNISMMETANLRLYEAFYIRKCKPTLNSREECSEFVDLLF